MVVESKETGADYTASKNQKIDKMKLKKIQKKKAKKLSLKQKKLEQKQQNIIPSNNTQDLDGEEIIEQDYNAANNQTQQLLQNSLEQQQYLGQQEELDDNQEFEIEYVSKDEYLLTGQYYEEFKNVFKFFQPRSLQTITEESNLEKNLEEDDEEEKRQAHNLSNQQVPQQQIQQEEIKLSKKKLKQQKRLKIAQLKALVPRPDLVEAWDITSHDPLLLVFLKSVKNSVQVPRHWSQKRKYLQNKRGILKQPFQLPESIEATGIAKLRDPFTERDGMKMVKQKLKERMNPKMGKIDIDYSVLHDAFYKNQKKPPLTGHGQIYYEGKENQLKMQHFKPGKISANLRAALGISELTPPPWINNMQRYGPPPSYPHLKIPGLNAPIAGQTNSYGKFTQNEDEEIDKGLWGFINEEEQFDDQDELYEDEEEEEEEPVGDYSSVGYPSQDDPEAKSGTSSVLTGYETPELDIRKLQGSNQDQKQLYQILEQTQKSVGGQVLGSTHGYVMPNKK